MEFNRQIFTLFHELAHIIFKESYLDVFDEYFWQLEYSQADHIEVKCNAFASEFLVPNEDILQRIGNSSSQNLDDFYALAETYKVSKEVILRKLLSVNTIDRKRFSEEVKKLQKAYQNFAIEKKKNKKPGGSSHNNQISYLGDAFLKLVIAKYSQGKISIEEASEHLNLKTKSFLEIEDRFVSRGGFA
jgi:Zn-dependent peptidase ImmA (M78 family)